MDLEFIIIIIIDKIAGHSFQLSVQYPDPSGVPGHSRGSRSESGSQLRLCLRTRTHLERTVVHISRLDAQSHSSGCNRGYTPGSCQVTCPGVAEFLNYFKQRGTCFGLVRDMNPLTPDLRSRSVLKSELTSGSSGSESIET